MIDRRPRVWQLGSLLELFERLGLSTSIGSVTARCPHCWTPWAVRRGEHRVALLQQRGKLELGEGPRCKFVLGDDEARCDVMLSDFTVEVVGLEGKGRTLRRAPHPDRIAGRQKSIRERHRRE